MEIADIGPYHIGLMVMKITGAQSERHCKWSSMEIGSITLQSMEKMNVTNSSQGWTGKAKIALIEYINGCKCPVWG